MLPALIALACTRAAPEPALPAQPSALALALSADSFGLKTLWIAADGEQVAQPIVHDGLRLHTAVGPQHLQEIAARAEKACASSSCALTLSRVVDGRQAGTLRAALEAEAASAVGCLDEHSLQRVQSATQERLVLADASGGAGCTDDAPGFAEIRYRTQIWGGRGLSTLPEPVREQLDAELRAAHPQQYDPALAGRAHVLRERAAGVSRDRAVVVTEDGAEVSVAFNEQVDPTDFAEILARWPGATDVLTAPDRRSALVRQGDQGLSAVRLSDGAVLWSVDGLPGRIAMAEWITGSELSMWEGALSR